MWKDCQVQVVSKLPFDIDGLAAYKLPFDPSDKMASTKDGRHWKQWVTSNRVGFFGLRRIASCSGCFTCKNDKCPYLESFEKRNSVKFIRKGSEIECTICGYQNTEKIPCSAKKVWEFHEESRTVTVYHMGNHTCTAVKPNDKDIRDDVAKYFAANPTVKPSQYTFEKLRGALGENCDVSKVYEAAESLYDVKKVKNIKQKTLHDLNQQGHSFDAIAKIKEESDKVDKYLLWKVVDGRFAEDGLTTIFRTSKEKLEILLQMQQGLDGAIAKEYCFLDAEHDLCSGMKTINLTILHPILREVTTVASMDCNEESTASLCRFWGLLNEVRVS